MNQVRDTRESRFGALYGEHYRRVLGLCRRLLRRSDHAEDAAQEAFLRAYRSLPSYDESQPFGRWVLNIAAHHCIDLLRRRSKERQLFGDEQTEARDLERRGGEEALQTLLTAERAEQIRHAVEALPDKYRLPLQLAYYGEASYEEIADALGVTRNHVGVLLLRAKRMLRAALAEVAAEEHP